MRSPQTPAEARLWSRIRRNQLYGFRFKRQHPIGPYIVDFYCGSCKLVIEIDGDSHVSRPQKDPSRTEWLVQQGCAVMRFWNTDVYENIEGVLEAILGECRKRARA